MAAALGSPGSTAPEDGATADSPALFPPSFVYSPATGKPLDPPPPKHAPLWLPPSGSQGLDKGLLRGGKLTRSSLRLREGFTSQKAAPLELLPPPGGHCNIMVSPCGLRSSFLFALDAKNGALYCWVPRERSWSEMLPADERCPYLGSDQLPYGVWSAEPCERGGKHALLWPSDAGLLAVALNPLAMTYCAEIISEGRCMSPALPLGGRHFVLQRRSGETATSMFSIAPEGGPPERKCSGIPDCYWACSAATPMEAIWLSNTGQAVANIRRQQYEFIPWEPEAVEPLFNFGPPHYARDGRLWMQVLHPQATPDGEEGRCFVSLGRRSYEKQSFLGVRFLTGQSAFKVEQRIQEDPWHEPMVAPGTHQKDEIVLPILESVSDHSLLTLRVYHSDSADSFLANRTAVQTRYQIVGQHEDDLGFHAARVAEPWLTAAFVYDGALYLYHPAFNTIPGWPLLAAGE